MPLFTSHFHFPGGGTSTHWNTKFPGCLMRRRKDLIEKCEVSHKALFYHTDHLWQQPLFHGDHGTKTRTLLQEEKKALSVDYC